ncbi:hypothetical protein GKC29_14775 [Micromonospora sp. WMMC415]|uniref:hypothetical protein n=1 Tax=Micromonospora sp. WMMC415 TaxID=2675222 RepID=UPI0012B498F3|nr:hypothetical protein [Micromonospora sp. WMMC415]QGN47985.1 hypothetical protein GKC29_14775 [Micromonospora sp. WMMC415]
MSTSRPTHVFSGDWLENTDLSCQHRYREGFAGIPAGRWNGWEVFTVTLQVMRAIVDSHHAEMTAAIAASVAAGAHLDEAWLDALQRMASVSWLGSLVVVDSRVLHSDPALVDVIAPDKDGRYRVGFGWKWDVVDPVDIHTIHHTADDGPSPHHQCPDGTPAQPGSTRREA